MVHPTKKFALNADQIRPLATGRGGCFATDAITVLGYKVGYMYREAASPGFSDSGWRFFAGNESPGYLQEPANIGIYDVNTIANYDAEIITLLDAPVGSAFERSDGGDGPLRPVVG